MVFIYVLELEQNKYYIGKTNNISFRIEQHIASRGSAWTTLYAPVRMIELVPDCDDFDEDKYTIKYMNKYGITNVRGGSFCQLVLSDENIHTINQMINGSSNKCYTCGESGHYAKECKKHVVGTTLSNEKCKCPTSWFSPHRKIKCALNVVKLFFEEVSDCSRCGRDSHQASNCYASKHINGHFINK